MRSVEQSSGSGSMSCRAINLQDFLTTAGQTGASSRTGNSKVEAVRVDWLKFPRRKELCTARGCGIHLEPRLSKASVKAHWTDGRPKVIAEKNHMKMCDRLIRTRARSLDLHNPPGNDRPDFMQSRVCVRPIVVEKCQAQ